MLLLLIVTTAGALALGEMLKLLVMKKTPPPPICPPTSGVVRSAGIKLEKLTEVAVAVLPKIIEAVLLGGESRVRSSLLRGQINPTGPIEGIDWREPSRRHARVKPDIAEWRSPPGGIWRQTAAPGLGGSEP